MIVNNGLENGSGVVLVVWTVDLSSEYMKKRRGRLTGPTPLPFSRPLFTTIRCTWKHLNHLSSPTRPAHHLVAPRIEVQRWTKVVYEVFQTLFHAQQVGGSGYARLTAV